MSNQDVGLTPRARSENLIVQELPNEMLVYDLRSHRAHCLNRTASLVWTHCDGEKSTAQMSLQLSNEVGAPVPEELIHLALEQLGRARLLVHPFPSSKRKDVLARRQVIGRIGLLAIGVPLVTSLLVPTAQAAVSKTCVGINGLCDPGGVAAPPCCSGFVCLGNVCAATPP